jgi:DNA-binding CsgD family transcriptional regulator
MARRYTEEDVANWYARYQEGRSIVEVAKDFGVSPPTVHGAFLRRRLDRRPPHRRGPDIQDRPEFLALPASKPATLSDREWRILVGRRAGETLAAIGRELGISRQRTYQLEKRALSTLATSAGSPR